MPDDLKCRMLDLTPYLQAEPDEREGVPEKVERTRDLLKAKRAVLDRVPLFRPAKVLDIGPAMGWEAIQLRERYGSVHCVTLFEQEAAALRRLGLEVTVCDMHRLPAGWTQRFDIVFASHVLEHSPAPYVALSEWLRVLKVGGWLAVVMPNAGGYVHLHRPRPKRMGSMPGHVFCASFETVVEMLRHVKMEPRPDEEQSAIRFRFDAYYEVPQPCLGQLGYWNRIWLAQSEEVGCGFCY